MARTKTERKDGWKVGVLWLRKAKGSDVAIYYVDEWVQKNDGKNARCRKSTDIEEAAGAYNRALEKREAILKDFKGDLQHLTFPRWVETYRDSWEKTARSRSSVTGQIASGTIGSHSGQLPHLLDFFGDVVMDRITPTRCLNYYHTRLTMAPLDRWRRERRCPACGQESKTPRSKCQDCLAIRMSENSVIKECQFAQSIFEAAVVAGVIEKNPWRATRLNLTIGDRARGRALSLIEQDKFLAVASDEMQRFVKLGVGLGIRVGMMLNLPMPEQVPWINATIHGTATAFPVISLPSKGKLYETGVLPHLWSEYVAQAAFMRRKKPLATKIFAYHYTSITDKIARTCRAAGIDYFVTHDLRRTFATQLDEQQMPEEQISKLLNHSNVAVTRKYIKGEKEKRALIGRYQALLTSGVAVQ